MDEKNPSPPPQKSPSRPSVKLPTIELQSTQPSKISSPQSGFVEIRVESPTPTVTSPTTKQVRLSDNKKPEESPESPTKKLTREEMQAEIDSLLIYTKAVKWPTLYQSLTEKRFINRVLQLIFGLVAFLNLGYTALVSNYTSLVLDNSGIPFFCFVSITSIVSFKFLITVCVNL